MPFLYFYAICLGIGAGQTALVMGANTNTLGRHSGDLFAVVEIPNTIGIFAVKFGWNSNEV